MWCHSPLHDAILARTRATRKERAAERAWRPACRDAVDLGRGIAHSGEPYTSTQKAYFIQGARMNARKQPNIPIFTPNSGK